MNFPYNAPERVRTDLGKATLVRGPNKTFAEIKLEKPVNGNRFVLRAYRDNLSWRGTIYTPDVRSVRKYGSVQPIFQRINIGEEGPGEIYNLFDGEVTSGRIKNRELRASFHKGGTTRSLLDYQVKGGLLGLFTSPILAVPGGMAIVFANDLENIPEFLVASAVSTPIMGVGIATKLWLINLGRNRNLDQGGILLRTYEEAYGIYSSARTENSINVKDAKKHSKAKETMRSVFRELEKLSTGLNKDMRKPGIYFDFEGRDMQELIEVSKELLDV